MTFFGVSKSSPQTLDSKLFCATCSLWCMLAMLQVIIDCIGWGGYINILVNVATDV